MIEDCILDVVMKEIMKIIPMLEFTFPSCLVQKNND